MAVQKSKKSRARRGMRRSGIRVKSVALSVDSYTGETHRRHHITAQGYYRGKQVIAVSQVESKDQE